ncbi:MAG: response regulator [Symplocastrum torsivum CPER-KK1]|jgi:DNA-binding NarL/FixJ family response regulator|uniref:Response regulator n=1 Tax=Symplocastrum torsivum CPER-KK1 TaxID=450513 RepID=A0A951PGN1_9CYAN|nr:response regulator transcription factor [Microcoleus sp. FACHB-SPT15]MBD1806868.1 response regulator transcription factor [Microcoleus sp. FACHB-SPT15]MBW4543093.1 response regulator [Symplocastrum torsivum CPER-KK1]
MSAQVLLVDDEPGVRLSVKEYLQEIGDFKVRVASSADEAWQLLQQQTPDLVISDVMMPQVDGYQFLKKLREDPRFKSLPVVFLTARGMTSDRILGYQSGVDAYLAKPFDPDELVAIVENLLERRSPNSGDASSTELEKIAQQIAEIRGLITKGNGIVQTPAPIRIDFTPREQSVLDLVAEGLMNKEIARRLETSVRNVEKYVSRLFSKTGTNSRTELVRYALEHGLTK